MDGQMNLPSAYAESTEYIQSKIDIAMPAINDECFFRIVLFLFQKKMKKPALNAPGIPKVRIEKTKVSPGSGNVVRKKSEVGGQMPLRSFALIRFKKNTVAK